MWLLDSLLFPVLNADTGTHHGWLTFAAFVSGVFPSLAAVVLAGLAVQGRPGMRARVVQSLAAMAVAWLAVEAIRQGFPVPRPGALGQGLQWLAHGPTSSFPSKHAAGAFACWWGLAGGMGSLRPARLLGPVFLLVALLIAWSRVCLGLHFPSDVLAGALIGTTAAFVVHRLWALLAPRVAGLLQVARRGRARLAEQG